MATSTRISPTTTTTTPCITTRWSCRITLTYSTRILWWSNMITALTLNTSRCSSYMLNLTFSAMMTKRKFFLQRRLNILHIIIKHRHCYY
uniref:Candidate secreted effector n=1 Tax=Meloidogyne incognita TaxID=6306 RepID=A0A914L088_MELIC